MLYFVTTKQHMYTMKAHVTFRGRALAPRLQLFSYQALLQARRVPAGTYIFCDLERLPPPWREAAATLKFELCDVHGLTVLNDPATSMRRYELLRTLKQEGINDFDVYRLNETDTPARFPVFIRGENDHAGSRTQVIGSVREFRRTLVQLDQAGIATERMIATEYCHTMDDAGIYRKYSAFNVGGRIIPRHLFFSRSWVVKMPDLNEPSMIEEEWRYVQQNPHKKELQRIFRLARIDYGRVDYGIFRGRIQVWEINTNPLVTSAQDGGGPARNPAHEHFSAAFQEACVEIDREAGPKEWLTIRHVVSDGAKLGPVYP